MTQENKLQYLSNIAIWKRKLASKELEFLKESQEGMITIEFFIKKGFWNKILRRKEIILYLNGKKYIALDCPFSFTLNFFVS
jgi:hypothetical protein